MAKTIEDLLGDFIVNAPLYKRLDLKPYAEGEEMPSPDLGYA